MNPISQPYTTITIEDRTHSIPSDQLHIHRLISPCPCLPTVHNNHYLHHNYKFTDDWLCPACDQPLNGNIECPSHGNMACYFL